LAKSRSQARSAQQALVQDADPQATPVTLAMIQALIPVGLRAVEDALVAEVAAFAGPRYAHHHAHLDVARWGRRPARSI
jgi:hypothetical protein